MLSEGEQNYQQAMSKTDGSFRCSRPSLARTEASSFGRNTGKTYLIKQDSQPTLPQLPPYSSRALDFEENIPLSPLEAQIGELMHRFSGIHRMLIEHSDQESQLHQRKRGFKVMPIDHALLVPDYSNKTNIIGDIVALVEGIEDGTAGRTVEETLETKFLEYYLERHYGGLNQCHNLSIQEKLQQLDAEEEEKIVVSKLEQAGSYLSSNAQPEQGCVVHVERIKIIQVQIPVMVYREKVEVVRVEESDIRVNNNIESIINRFSKPYSELYQQSPLPIVTQNPNQTTNPQTPAPSQIVASIMIDSNHLPPKETQIELIYSDFPEEHTFKLPLDSYAQLQSLISNEDNSSSQLSRPATDRDRFMPAAEETIVVQERGNSSILQRMEQGQRVLREENEELRETVKFLEMKVEELQARSRELSLQNERLSARLQEEIQQGEYLSGKLNQIDAQILEEKVDCLTHLNAAKERRIDALVKELEQRELRIGELSESVALLEKEIREGALQLQQKEQEMMIISKQLQEREGELRQLQNCEQAVIQIAATSEEGLRREISRLQAQNCELQQEVKQYRKRFKEEGINLLYDEATEIQGIIQSREHAHRLQLQDITRRYEQVAAIYRQELDDIKGELAELRAVNEKKTQLLASKDAQALLARMRNERYFKEMEEVVKQYDRELQQKDEEIMALKMQVLPQHEIQTLLDKFTTTITLLEKQLERQRSEKAQLTGKFMEMDEVLKSLLTKQKERDFQAEQRLIQELSSELQKKLNENSAIKQKMAEQAALIASLHQEEGRIAAAASIRRENQKLRDINRRLKRYTTILQGEIKAVCRIDQCQSHRACVSSLIDQKNYFCQLLTRENSLLETPTA